MDLHPAGFTTSEAFGTSGNQQVGYAGIMESGLELRAMLWSGTAASAIDLHPAAGYQNSIAESVSANTQVGAGINSLGNLEWTSHALMWRSTAESIVSLHPSGFQTSYATAVEGEWQAGYGKKEGVERALLWQGTADSVVDLHPAGLRRSKVHGMSETSQVGAGTNLNPHALLWHGTADSVVDLHPAGYLSSQAFDASVDTQVGIAVTQNGRERAMAWNGTSESAIDLHEMLQGLGFNLRDSRAIGISENGDIVGWAYDGTRGYAIKWTLVPEPPSIAILLLAIPALISMSRAGRRGRRE